jgi:NADH-quinone oxidoreductase subunit J
VSASEVAFWILTVVCLAGALVVVVTRGMMRMTLGLGAFLLGVAGFFLYYGSPFLAVAQLFVYVGGVLVLILLAIMVLRRDEAGRPELTSKVDIATALVPIIVFVFMNQALSPIGEELGVVIGSSDALEDLRMTLLGRMLPQFELVGVLLLAALVVSVAVVAKRERS